MRRWTPSLTRTALASLMVLTGTASAGSEAPGNSSQTVVPTPVPVEPQPAITAASLQALLSANNYIELASQLPQAVGLTADQAEYFRALLAYRQGRFAEVVNPLVDAVRAHDSALTPAQKENAFEILAQTEAKSFHYGASAKMYTDIEELFGAQMGDGLADIRERRHLEALLEPVPAQTVRIFGNFSLHRGADGSYPIRIGGMEEGRTDPGGKDVSAQGKDVSAQLDTGATLSLVSETTAKLWGVRLLTGEAMLHGYGGGGFAARPGVVDELQIGKAVLHNVVVFVTADTNLYIAQIKRQTNAVLGFPVVAALGRLTFARDGTVSVTQPNADSKSSNSKSSNSKGGAAMWVGDGSLLVALGTEPVIHGNKLLGGARERLFELDTGSANSYLTDHYLAENRLLFKGEPPSVARLAGAGGVHAIPAYQAAKLPLFFGVTPVLCSGQHVLTQPQGSEAENYYGVVGQDILRLFQSYTLDFRTMRMQVTP